jgi:hypothetical protein
MKVHSVLALLLFAVSAPAAVEEGFTSLFDGKTLDGWTLMRPFGTGCHVKDGLLVFPADGGGDLLSNKDYANFILRLEYRLDPAGNNGVGIRVPPEGHPSYAGMEIQILDDQHAQYKGKIRAEQHTGSVYDVIPARTGFQKPAGEWNQKEISVSGRHIRVTLNGVIILDADLDTVREAAVLKKHPGLTRSTGRIGFLGHKTRVEFRNIRIKELP